MAIDSGAILDACHSALAAGYDLRIIRRDSGWIITIDGSEPAECGTPIRTDVRGTLKDAAIDLMRILRDEAGDIYQPAAAQVRSRLPEWPQRAWIRQLDDDTASHVRAASTRVPVRWTDPDTGRMSIGRLLSWPIPAGQRAPGSGVQSGTRAKVQMYAGAVTMVDPVLLTIDPSLEGHPDLPPVRRP